MADGNKESATGAVLAMASLLLAAALLRWGWPPGFVWSWDAAAAVATFSAAGVALWLGWREGSWRRDQERLGRELSTLKWAKMHGDIRGAVWSLMYCADGPNEEFVGYEPMTILAEIDRVLAVIDGFDIAVPHQHDPTIAVSLALAVSSLKRARLVGERIVARREALIGSPADFVRISIMEAIRHLNAVGVVVAPPGAAQRT